MPGSILAGKYRVERVLGEGGMGIVVEARHLALDERVALKVLRPELGTNVEASTRFLREARNAVRIKSEHVARVSDVGTIEGGLPFMVMELLEGRDLADTLEQAGVLSIPDAVDFIIQGCEAIAEAHGHGIVHRDLKPANLFLARRADGSPLVKVLDFGLSKASGGGVEALTRTTTALGSALYMSPEQMQQTRSVDLRTDVYALGVSLYELIAGRQPFYAETLPQLCVAVLTGTPTPIRELRADVPEALAVVVERAFARDKAHRHQSIGELVVALAPFAPPRSAPTIERIARMAGLPVPELPVASSGVFRAPAGPIDEAPTPASGSSLAATQVLGEPMPIPAAEQRSARPGERANHGTMPMPVMDPSVSPASPAYAPPPAPPPPPNPNQILPGHYSAPVSVRAAASFKHGALAAPMIHGQPRNKGAILLLVAIALLGIAGILAALALRARSSEPAADPPPASDRP